MAAHDAKKSSRACRNFASVFYYLGTSWPVIAEHGRPIVDAIFAWMRECLTAQGLLGSQLTKALAYAHKRRARWRCFSQIRTCQSTPTASNGHCSRYGWPEINWLFTWTELGAQHLGAVQSLIATCRLHDMGSYDYLVDVFPRVAQAVEAELWKGTTAL